MSDANRRWADEMAEQQRQFRAALAKAEQERDELQASHDVLESQRNEAQAERDAARGAMVLAARERDAAVADNAALAKRLESTHSVLDHLWDTTEDVETEQACGVEASLIQSLLVQPHPGASLLDQHQKDLAEARYADDNAKAFADAICSTIEHAELLASTPKGGQSVPNHNDFAHVQPSTRGQLRWWAKCGRAALKGERSALLVRARNEGLERAAVVAADAAAKWDDEKGPGITIQTGKRGMAIAKAVRALREPEE